MALLWSFPQQIFGMSPHFFKNAKMMVPEIDDGWLFFYPAKTGSGSFYRLGKDHRKSQMLYQPKVFLCSQHKNA